MIVQLVVPRRLTETQRSLLEDYAKSEKLEVAAANPSLWAKIKDAVSGP